MLIGNADDDGDPRRHRILPGRCRMKCPGQDTQYWDAEAIYDVSCPRCDSPVEFYKDDTQRKCHACGHRFVNPRMDFGCASYCQFAEQCVGTLPEGVAIPGDNLLKDKVAVEMKRYWGGDFHRIGSAMRLARYAEPIALHEGAALAPTLCAAYLWEVAHVPGREHKDPQQVTVAEQLLVRAGAKDPLIGQVLSLLDRLAQNAPDRSPELLSLLDAKRIMEAEERYKSGAISLEILQELPGKLLTTQGIETAEQLMARYRQSPRQTTAH